MRRFTLMLLSLALLVPAAVHADPPPGYYATADISTPETLRDSVHDIIDDHTKIPYTSSSTDTWNVLEFADEDPYNSSRVLDVYRNATYTKQGGGNSYYNREHSWPNSYGFPDDGSSNKPYTDCHHLFICNISYNSSRGNLYYDDCVSGCTSYSAEYYDGQSGTNRRDSNSWETWQGRKGDVARAMFYMDVRYEGDSGSEPDLILTDNASLIQTSGGNNASVAYMGLLQTLLEWHLDDPVDDKERVRNDAVHTYQGNRNPFIDHPEWVAYIFDDGAVDTPAVASLGPVIASVHPNPFNPRTTVAYDVADSGAVRLEIYAPTGRRVRTLVDGFRPEGSHTAIWDGTNEQGLRVSSGVYFLMLRGAAGADMRKLVMIK